MQISIGLYKLKNFYSGGVAGVVSMTTVYPLETIRTRLSLQMNKSHYTNPLQAARSLKLNQMYKGLGISILGFGPFSALNFMFYYYFKDLFESKTTIFSFFFKSILTTISLIIRAPTFIA